MSATESAQASVPAADVKSEQPEVSASAAEGRRLYIGNLAYATTEEELRTFFKDFLVEAVSIPTNPRTNRPVGYAFVDLSTPTEAERAIAELNGQTIVERKVSIQLARKPEAQGEGAASGGEGGSGKENRRRGSNRGRGRGRGRGGRTAGKGRQAEQEPNADGTQVTEVTGAEVGQAKAAAEGTTATEGADKAERAPRKQRGPPEDGIPSKTKVMVANLPYDLREEKLIEIFSEYSPASAKIALRPIPRFMVKKLQARGEARKGRGFGFVTLASEELQQKAVNEMNGKVIEGREIAVKVAIDSPGKEDDDLNAPANGDAAASTEEKAAVPAETATETSAETSAETAAAPAA